MAKQKRKKKNRHVARQLPPEEPRTEAITVAWMLSTMVTLGALCLSGLALLMLPHLASDEGDVGALAVIPGLLLVVATVTATVALMLMACAIRFRRTRPPRLIIVVSTGICILPFVVHLWMAAR